MQIPISVSMLGAFSIEYDGRILDESSNRMRKVWLLLAYLIYARNSRCTQDQYISVIQGADSSEIDDPTGRLKALFYRARTMLNQLYDNAGHTLIIRKNGTYAWNAEAPLTLDVEQFEELCRNAAAAREAQDALALYRRALTLYRGDFLAKYSMEPWVMPISAYYHQLYMKAVDSTVQLLQAQQQWEEISRICTQALKIEPYSEALYQNLMRCRLALGDRGAAVSLYEEMSELLFNNFGVMPDDASRRLYRDACKQVNDQTVPIGTVKDQLREDEEVRGAIYCEYDFFRFLYQVQARSIVRSGDVVHIALLSLHGENRESLPRRSLDRAMENLQELLLKSLRRGDVICRCSVSQMIIMLPQANYENSCAICQRLIKAFFRQYPHSPARIHYAVQPLEPRS